MQSAQFIKAQLQLGENKVSLDMKDAYFHIPIHPQFRRYMRFAIGNQVYQFCAMCFGLTPTPFVFTMILRSLTEYLRKEGILIHFYLDDWIIRARSKRLFCSHENRVMSLARKLGIIINLTKSNLIPKSWFIHLRIDFDFVQGLVLPTQDSLNKIKLWSKYLYHYKKATEHGSTRQTSFTSSLVLPKMLQDSLNTTIMLDQMFFQALAWWENPQNLTQEATLHPENPSFTILTDASKTRWGGGVWSSGRPNHIKFMVANRILSPHKCTEDQSSNINSKTFHPSNHKGVCSYNVRQYYSSFTYQETGRNTLLIPILPDATIIPVVNTTSSHTESKIHPRSPEYNGGPSELQRSSSQSRMDLVETGIQTNPLCFSKSPSRSICDISQSSTSFVCEPISRQEILVNRCSDNTLVKHKWICFSSHNNHRPSIEEGRRDRLYNSPNSPILAQLTMVASLLNMLVESPIMLTPNRKLLNQPNSNVFHSKPESLKLYVWTLSRLDLYQKDLNSKEVAKMVSKTQRKSSLSVYQTHFNSFTDWCKTRDTNLESVSIRDVADYLIYMFKTLGRQVATICNNRTTISAALWEINGFTVITQ